MKKFRYKVKVALAIIGFIVAFQPSITNATTLTFIATENSVVLDGSNTNNQSLSLLGSELNTSSEGDIWLSILKFDLSSLAGMTINSATFELTASFNHSEEAFLHEVYSSSDDSWSESTITGVNRPLDSSLTSLNTIEISGLLQTYSWDVINGVIGNDGLAGENNLLTLLVRPELSQMESGGFGPHFYNREDPSFFPVLLVDASPVPVPTAIWFFSSALIGLFGARIKLEK